MSRLLFANNATTTLAGSLSTGTTTIPVASGTAALFPQPGAGEYFVLSLFDQTNPSITEICWCTGIAGDNLTVVRAREGTTALTWSIGDVVNNDLTAGQMTDMYGALLPTGTLLDFAASTPPAGFLKCDGAAVSRVTYAALFGVIGTTWGVGDGTTTFNVPDLRGYFTRGWADGGTRDPGRVFASAQDNAMQHHAHVTRLNTNFGGTGIPALEDGSSITLTPYTSEGPIAEGANPPPNVAGENRPDNVAVLKIIKT